MTKSNKKLTVERVTLCRLDNRDLVKALGGTEDPDFVLTVVTTRPTSG